MGLCAMRLRLRRDSGSPVVVSAMEAAAGSTDLAEGITEADGQEGESHENHFHKKD